MHKVLKCSSAGFISCPRCSDPAASLVLFLDMSEAYTIYFYSWPEVACPVAGHFVCNAESCTAAPYVCGAAWGLVARLCEQKQAGVFLFPLDVLYLTTVH